MGNRLVKFENVTTSSTETDSTYILHQNELRVQRPLLERQLEKQSRRMGGTLNLVSSANVDGQRVQTSNSFEFVDESVNNLYQANTNKSLLNRDLFARKKSIVTAQGDEYSIQIVNVPNDDLFGFLTNFKYNPLNDGLSVPKVFQVGRYGTTTLSSNVGMRAPDNKTISFEYLPLDTPLIKSSESEMVFSTPPAGDLVFEAETTQTGFSPLVVDLYPGRRFRAVPQDADNFRIYGGSTSAVYRNGGNVSFLAGQASTGIDGVNTSRTGGDIDIIVPATSATTNQFKSGDIFMRTGQSSDANDQAKTGAFTLRAPNGGDVIIDLDGFSMVWPRTNGVVGSYLRIASIDGSTRILEFA
jgi:hypothetical protein